MRLSWIIEQRPLGSSLRLSTKVLSVSGPLSPGLLCGGRGDHEERQRPLQHPGAADHHRELR